MKSKRLKINGLTHQLRLWGKPSNPKLFLFHGWMDMGASFNDVCQRLAKRYYCIAPDLRGMGKTEHTPNELGYFFYEYVADLHTLFEKLAPNERIKILGHSMGGNIVSLYAGTFPEQISHLINVEGFGIRDNRPEDGPDRMRNWIESRRDRKFRYYPNLKAIAERLSAANPKLSAKQATFLARHLSRRSSKGYQIAADPRHKWINPYLFQVKNIIPFWKQIKARCLLVMAEHTESGLTFESAAVAKREMEKRLDYFPKKSKRVVIKNAGHMIHFDEPEALAQAILRFLP